MRIAIPIIGEDVAPRFCFADRAIIVELEDGREWSRERIPLGQPTFPSRLRLLQGLGVTRLVCGGFNRTYLPMAEGMGITVTWGLWGEAAAIISAFVASPDAFSDTLGTPAFHDNEPRGGGPRAGRRFGRCSGAGGPGQAGGRRRRRRHGRGGRFSDRGGPLPPQAPPDDPQDS